MKIFPKRTVHDQDKGGWPSGGGAIESALSHTRDDGGPRLDYYSTSQILDRLRSAEN